MPPPVRGAACQPHHAFLLPNVLMATTWTFLRREQHTEFMCFAHLLKLLRPANTIGKAVYTFTLSSSPQNFRMWFCITTPSIKVHFLTCVERQYVPHRLFLGMYYLLPSRPVTQLLHPLYPPCWGCRSCSHSHTLSSVHKIGWWGGEESICWSFYVIDQYAI